MADEILHLSLNDIEIVSNTRTSFDENALKELALSIKTNGVIQPITVKPLASGKFRLICGERRFRASLLAGKPDITARVFDVPDHKILQYQIVENLQRRNISTMDEVRSIVRLRDEEGMTGDQIAKAIGKASSHVAKQLQISRADNAVHDALDAEQISRQVGLLIAALDEPEKQSAAVIALKRDRAAYHVKVKDAEKWINQKFGVGAKKTPGDHQPKTAGRFASGWKYYLVRFSAEQFARFQSVVGSRVEIPVWAEAVENVMTETQKGQVAKV